LKGIAIIEGSSLLSVDPLLLDAFGLRPRP